MKNAPRILAAGLIGWLVVTGCASGREIIRLEIPSLKTAAKNGMQVFIRSVADNRQFEENPISPDTPSLDISGASAEEIKSRVVGRKRNMYGKAQGNILLEKNKTAASNVAQITADALSSLGYEVVLDESAAKPEAIVMDISVEQYWAWFVPGFGNADLSCRIVAVISLETPDGEQIRIKAAAHRKTGVAGRYAWQETFKSAHEQYTASAEDIFQQKNPLPIPVSPLPSQPTEVMPDKGTAAPTQGISKPNESTADKEISPSPPVPADTNRVDTANPVAP